MRKRIMAAAAATALMAALAVPMLGAGGAAAAPAEKITICHATGSETNPVVIITVSGNSWEKGHGRHHDGADSQLGEGCEDRD